MPNITLSVSYYNENGYVIAKKEFTVTREYLEKYLNGYQTVEEYLEECTSDTNENIYCQAVLDDKLIEEKMLNDKEL